MSCLIMIFSSEITLNFYFRLSFRALILATGKRGSLTTNKNSSVYFVDSLGLIASSKGLPLMFFYRILS